MAENDSELVFVPLGGVGEIGMNAALYGVGPRKSRKWIMVDCGMGFAGEEHLPGVDVMYPDPTFAESVRKDILAILITHAHEDHIGALGEIAPRLRVPIYATRFAKNLIETRRQGHPGAPKMDLREIAPGQRMEFGPFSIEYVPVAHSIPESNAIAIRTEHGLVVHTGDWKLDDTPVLGATTSEAAFRALGEEGILALVCDSTNVVREGRSPSESDVAATLAKLIREAPQRVAITTFASNVARMRAVADAAKACGREVVMVGRAMDRVAEVARECGYLDGLPDFRRAEAYDRLPREKVVAMLTGSQGEERAAMARIARRDHPDVELDAGDRVIFSSRAIPGNEREVGAIINDLVLAGVEVITDRTDLVHVSGHPRRDEMTEMYAWTRPKISVPVHGEALHLRVHADFARAQGVEQVVSLVNGRMVRLAPGKAEAVEHVPVGRLYRDGEVVIKATDRALPERRKLASTGIVSVAIALDRQGEIRGEPAIDVMGIPDEGRKGEPLLDIVAETVTRTLQGLSRHKRRDPEAVENAVDRALRSTLNGVWGKKPACHVLVVEI